eukprot:848125-Amphidinium_carterae.1
MGEPMMKSAAAFHDAVTTMQTTMVEGLKNFRIFTLFLHDGSLSSLLDYSEQTDLQTMPVQRKSISKAKELIARQTCKMHSKL